MKLKRIAIALLIVGFLFCSCDYGQLGGADRTATYYPTDGVFTERMAFFEGVWDSGYDNYRVHKWGTITDKDKAVMKQAFPAVDVDHLSPIRERH